MRSFGVDDHSARAYTTHHSALPPRSFAAPVFAGALTSRVQGAAARYTILFEKAKAKSTLGDGASFKADSP